MIKQKNLVWIRPKGPSRTSRTARFLGPTRAARYAAQQAFVATKQAGPSAEMAQLRVRLSPTPRPQRGPWLAFFFTALSESGPADRGHPFAFDGRAAISRDQNSPPGRRSPKP